MVKILQKSSPEPVDWFPRNLVCGTGDSGLMIVCSHDNPGLTLTCFTTMSNCVTYAILYKKVKTIDFSETIAACDLKDGRCIQLNE